VQRRLSDISELEDICQEIMVAVYKSRHTYQPYRPFEPWLSAIIRNVSGKHIRRNQERLATEVYVDELPEIVESSWAVEMDLRQAVERLSPAQFEAFGLIKLLGLSVAEAAKRTGASVSAIKVRTHPSVSSR
jgi:RNA polymerase sigma-70 factor, ECF subfamily